jgi:hypothetical protein
VPHVQNTVEGICDYQKKRGKHVERMQRNGISGSALQYIPSAIRSAACPVERWEHKFSEESSRNTIGENESRTGSRRVIRRRMLDIPN